MRECTVHIILSSPTLSMLNASGPLCLILSTSGIILDRRQLSGHPNTPQIPHISVICRSRFKFISLVAKAESLQNEEKEECNKYIIIIKVKCFLLSSLKCERLQSAKNCDYSFAAKSVQVI